MAHRAGLGLGQLEAVAILLLLGLFPSGLGEYVRVRECGAQGRGGAHKLGL